MCTNKLFCCGNRLFQTVAIKLYDCFISIFSIGMWHVGRMTFQHAYTMCRLWHHLAFAAPLSLNKINSRGNGRKVSCLMGCHVCMCLCVFVCLSIYLSICLSVSGCVVYVCLYFFFCWLFCSCYFLCNYIEPIKLMNLICKIKQDICLFCACVIHLVSAWCCTSVRLRSVRKVTQLCW